ncbi:MAG: CBS domain-containing protein [Streptosporangiaceae bacterium]
MTVARTTEAAANPGETGTEHRPAPDPNGGQAVVIRSDSGGIHAVAEPDDTLRAMCMDTVADVMVRHPKLCHEDSTAGDVRQLFADDHVHAILIMSGTRLLTVIDRADLGPEAADSEPAARLGRLNGRVIAPTASADAALQQLILSDRRRLAVAGPDGTLLGLLCLKRSGTGLCSDESVRQRHRERLQQRIT